MNEPIPPDHPEAVRRFSHHAMACSWGLGIVEADADYADQVARAAFEEVDRLETELSRFHPESDVSRINRLGAGEATTVGIEVFECLELGREIGERTAGAFDLCPESRTRWSLDRSSRRVTVDGEGISIDLGSIGKGYALDRVMELLGDWEVEAAVLNSGQSTVLA